MTARCLNVADRQGRRHALGHDGGDSKELDPGAAAERASGQRPRCGQVILVTAAFRAQRSFFHWLLTLIPAVLSVPALQAPRSHPEVLPKPDVTQDSAAGRAPQPAAKSVAEKRGKGRYKTFDWAEFWPQSRPEGLLGNRPPSFMELGDLERQRRREERRKRYESTLGVSLRREDGEQETRDVSAKLQQEEIEEFWRLVERSALRPDKTVPLGAAEANAAETEKLLRSCMKAVRAETLALHPQMSSEKNRNC